MKKRDTDLAWEPTGRTIQANDMLVASTAHRFLQILR